MRCRVAKSWFDRAIDRELGLEESLRFEAHLADCSNCRTAYRRLIVLEEHVRGAEEPVLTMGGLDAAWARLEARLEAGAAKGSESEFDAPVSPEAPEWAIDRTQSQAAGGGDSPRVGRPILLPRGSRLRVAVGLALALGFGALALRFGGHGSSGDGNEANAPSLSHDLASLFPRAEEETDAQAAGAAIEDALLATFGSGDEASPQDLDAFATRVRPFSDWPVARFAASALAAPDPRLARSAARYLGLRADRSAVADLERALSRSAVTETVADALGRIGSPAVPALARALDERSLRTEALHALARIGDEASARSVESALSKLLKVDALPEDAAPFLDALAAMGDPALPSLARLARQARQARGPRGGFAGETAPACLLLERLPRMRVSGAAVARVLSSRECAGDLDLAFDFAAGLGGSGALGFLVERARESRTRTRALRILSTWSGPDAVAALLELDVAGAVDEADLLATLRELAERSPGRMELEAERLVAARAQSQLERYLELLAASRSSGAAGALVVIAQSNLLPEDSRQWAALSAGALGGEREALLLAAAASSIEPGERRLLAAYLLTIHRHLGVGGVLDALSDRPDWVVPKVLEALSGAPEVPDSVLLFRVARALNGALSTSNYPTNSSST